MYLAWYYYCMKNNPFRQFVLGVSFLLPAHGMVGARATIKNLASSKNFLAKFKQAGKKKKGVGKVNFCPPALPHEARLWGGKWFILAKARKQSPQKLKHFLEVARKNFFQFQLRNQFLRALSAIRRRAAGRGAAPQARSLSCPKWLRDLDSNQDTGLQRPVSYH